MRHYKLLPKTNIVFQKKLHLEVLCLLIAFFGFSTFATENEEQTVHSPTENTSSNLDSAQKPDTTTETTNEVKKSEITSEEKTVEPSEQQIAVNTGSKITFKFIPANLLIKSTDNTNKAQASIATKTTLGGSVAYNKFLTSSLSFDLDLLLKNVEFKPIDERGLVDSKNMAFDLNLKIQKHHSEKSISFVKLSLVDSFYVYGLDEEATPTTNLIAVGKIKIPKISLGLNQQLYSKSTFKLLTEVSPYLLLSKKNDLISKKIGYGGEAKLIGLFEQNSNPRNYLLSTFFRYEKQNSNLANQNSTELGLEIGFTWGTEP